MNMRKKIILILGSSLLRHTAFYSRAAINIFTVKKGNIDINEHKEGYKRNIPNGHALLNLKKFNTKVKKFPRHLKPRSCC